MPSTIDPMSPVGWPPLSRTHFITAVAAPLRTERTLPSSVMSTPDMRVCALNATHLAWVSSPTCRSRSPNSVLA